jgi:hypothetical protein
MTLWNVEFTDQFEEWWETLSGDEQRALTAAVQLLERDGPALGRPLADTIKGSRHRNMKELRPPATALRVLFAFDPRRTAILLIGGNKQHRWREWYAEFIPVADSLYDEHLAELRREGELR